MFMYMKPYFGHFDWYNRYYQLIEPLQYSSFLHFMISVFGCHNNDGRYIWDVAHATTDQRPYHSKSCAFPFVEPVKVWVLCFLR